MQTGPTTTVRKPDPLAGAVDAPPGAAVVLGGMPTRRQTLSRARELGLSVIAALPYHYPRALLRAHRCHAIEVWAPTAVPVDSGSRHFQAYTCSIVTRGTAFLLDQGLQQVDAVLVPHGCDALQGMGSVLTDFVADRPPILTLYPPRTRRSVDRDYLIAEYRVLADRLAALSGFRPKRADWAEALRIEDAADDALRSLYANRATLVLSDLEFHTAVRAREYLLAEDFVAMVEALPHGPAPVSGTGIVLSGIVPEPMGLLDHLAEAGACVAADDLSSGSRRVLPPSRLKRPFDRFADQFMRGPADPTRSDPIAARVGRLLGLLRDSGARGLLIYTPTYCEPELFYLPLVRQAVTDAGVPMLHVEFEIGGGTLPAQTVTRIEAFVEGLS